MQANATISPPAHNGQNLKAIETIYRGDKFRSRLEARWAVFFDALGIEYRYELEGYDLDDGIRYLPDFFLPDSETYVEIKPTLPTYEETEKARTMHLQSGKDVVILYGNRLDFSTLGAVVFPGAKIGNIQPSAAVSCFIKHLAYCQLQKSARALLTYLDCLSVYPTARTTDLDNRDGSHLSMFKVTPNEAMTLARQARFEHGRNGIG